MVSVGIGVIVFIFCFGGALLGLYLHPKVPRSHMTVEAQEAVRLSTGMIATLASVVLGLLITNVKSGFDSISQDVERFGTSLILLDQTLRQLGPPADAARQALREYTKRAIQDVWPDDSAQPIKVENADSYEVLRRVGNQVLNFDPADRLQRILIAEAVQRYQNVNTLRWRLIEESGTTVSVPLLAMLIFWMAISFAGFGFNAPRNALVLGAMATCALSIAFALFMTVEMDGAFTGLVKVSAAPLRTALARESNATAAAVSHP
jgi:hypothetical protein